MTATVGWSRPRSAVAATTAVVALTGLQLVRRPGTSSWQTIWAEDGAVYGSDALAHPWWRSLFRGYAGYVQLVPRLLAALVRVVPISGTASLFAAGAALV